MKHKPMFQGALDGLCGPYAVVNAFYQFYESTLTRDDRDDLFKLVLSAIPKRRFPEMIWNGTSFGEMKIMCRAARDWANERLDGSPFEIRVSCPFDRKPPTTIAEYWRRFDDVIHDGTHGAAVLGMSEPDPHWTVVYKGATKRIGFFDSGLGGEQYFKNRSSLTFGRSTSPNRYRLEPRELVLIQADYRTGDATTRSWMA